MEIHNYAPIGSQEELIARIAANLRTVNTYRSRRDHLRQAWRHLRRALKP